MREPSRIERILDRAHSAVVSVDAQGRVSYWNPQAEAVFGIAREAAVGQPVVDLIIPEHLRQAYLDGMRNFIATGSGPPLDRTVEFTARRADGQKFPVEIAISALREGESWSFTAFIQDISQRRAEERRRERMVTELRDALQGSERLLDAILGSLADPVTIRSINNRLLYANRAALEFVGADSRESVTGTEPLELMGSQDYFGEDGSPLTVDQIPSVRLLRGERADPLLVRTVAKGSGQERWSLMKAAPVLDDEGELEAAIMFIEDVTDQKRAERRAVFLAQASEILASSLDYEQTLRNVAQLAVPDIADWCAVDLIGDRGQRVSVAVAHSDPERLHLARELRAYESEDLDPERGLGRVLNTGESLVIPEITDEMLVEGAVDERHLELLRAVGFCSVAIVPMRIGNRTLGAMTLVTAESRLALSQADIELLDLLAARAAVAIENSRVYSERSRIAHTLQQSLLPDELPKIPGHELASFYVPAVQSSEVGGDFYDAWETEDGWMITIGDVTGKGVDAAAVTALVRHTMRASADFVSSPAALMARLNRTLYRRRVPSFCTAVCLRLGPETIDFTVAGHPLPLLLTLEGVQAVGRFGPLLGAFPQPRWQDHSLVLPVGGTLLLYTDGVTDAVGRDGSRYGADRLQEILAACGERSASEVVDTLTSALERFQGGGHADDIAALVLRRSGPSVARLAA